MPNLVQIGDDQVDIEDPCAVVIALRKVELSLVTNGGVIRARFGEDDVQFSASNLSRLRDLMDRYERLCAAKSGKRVRYAKRIRFTRC
ncbi:MAG: hypothetical protein ACU0CF_19790 [Sagittula sp.]|uniref:hypothetical protein n=1 Tax=Sagittula sp. TaxID=2038081 RepID=UPI0040585B9C